jgi:hypothetical protein
MRTLLVFIILTILQSCNSHSTNSDIVTNDKTENHIEYPKLVFTELKDSVRVLISNCNFQRIDLVLGIDSVGIIGGKQSKYQSKNIKSSLTLKIDTNMFMNGKIDGAFQCWDSVKNIYRFYPLYDLYKK